MRTILKELKEYKLVSFMTPVFMILEVIMETIIPYMMGSIVDSGVKQSNLNHIFIMGGGMLVAAAFSVFCGIMGGRCGSIASTGLARNLRKTMFERIQTFSFANIDHFSTSGLVTRLTTDVTNVQQAYMMMLRMLFRAPISIIAAMAMSFFISTRIALIYLCAVVLLSIALGIIMISAHKYFVQVFDRYDDLNESVQENVSAIRVVKAYVREDYEKKRFGKASRLIYDLFCKAEKIVAFNGPLMNIAVYTCIILISWTGAHMVIAGSLTTGNLMSLLTYCMSILMNLMMLSFVFVMLAISAASIKRISEVLNEESSLSNPQNPEYEVADGSIEFKDVTFRYNEHSDKPVLDHINLSIASGETIGVIGGTGSSKSSLVSLISRLYDVSEGSVVVGGKDVREYDMDSLRNQVSVVLQKNVLFSGTIYDNLRWGDLNATEEECERACKLACADEFIERMPEKYNTYIEQGGSNVSGGQKQRLCIARALLKKPKILILDDSTSAVDTATDAKIRKAFAEEIPNTTKIIIAQRVSSVMNADRIIVMEDGKIDGIGTHDELVANNAIYREVYESQTNGSGDFDEGGES